MRTRSAPSRSTHLRFRRVRVRPGSLADWALEILGLLMGVLTAMGLVGLSVLLAGLVGRG